MKSKRKPNYTKFMKKPEPLDLDSTSVAEPGPVAEGNGSPRVSLDTLPLVRADRQDLLRAASDSCEPSSRQGIPDLDPIPIPQCDPVMPADSQDAVAVAEEALPRGEDIVSEECVVALDVPDKPDPDLCNEPEPRSSVEITPAAAGEMSLDVPGQPTQDIAADFPAADPGLERLVPDQPADQIHTVRAASLGADTPASTERPGTENPISIGRSAGEATAGSLGSPQAGNAVVDRDEPLAWSPTGTGLDDGSSRLGKTSDHTGEEHIPWADILPDAEVSSLQPAEETRATGDGEGSATVVEGRSPLTERQRGSAEDCPVLPRLNVVAGPEGLSSEPASSPDHMALLQQPTPAIQTGVEPSLPAVGPHADPPRPMRSLVEAPSTARQTIPDSLSMSNGDKPDPCPTRETARDITPHSTSRPVQWSELSPRAQSRMPVSDEPPMPIPDPELTYWIAHGPPIPTLLFGCALLLIALWM